MSIFTLLAINVKEYILIWFISIKHLFSNEQYNSCNSPQQIEYHVCHLLEQRNKIPGGPAQQAS